MADIRFDNLGPGEYERAKTVLNKAKHPGFVGRELFYRCATTGIVCIAVIGEDDVGVAMVAKEKLQALSVVVSAQGQGVGPALINRLQPKWVNAIGERVGFFEKLGYKCYGAPKVGQNGKHATQLMERGEVAASPEGSKAPADSEAPAAPAESLDSQLDRFFEPSRGPARARAILTVEERITHIVGMMERLEWMRGKSAAPLAVQWGLSVSTVENNAAEAHRRVMSEEACGEIKRELIMGSVKLFRDAVAAGQPRDARSIGELLANVSGAKAPQKIDATITDASDDERLARKLASLAAGLGTSEDPGAAEPGGTTTH